MAEVDILNTALMNIKKVNIEKVNTVILDADTFKTQKVDTDSEVTQADYNKQGDNFELTINELDLNQNLSLLNSIANNISTASVRGSFNNKIILPSSINIKGRINKLALNSEISSQLYKANTRLKDSHTPLRFDIGVDEVGRGPLYGSVVVAAVILPSAWSDDIINQPLMHTPLATLTDSKKISEKKRNSLMPLIKLLSIGYVLVEIPACIIDCINIYQATMLGMQLASEALIYKMTQKTACVLPRMITLAPTGVLKKCTSLSDLDFCKVSRNAISSSHFELLIDGNTLPKFEWDNMLLRRLVATIDKQTKESQNINEVNHSYCKSHINAQALVQGDSRHTAIAAASVLAKVSRDSTLVAASKLYPNYQFEKHKGYPTKAHLSALEKYGALPEHRRSFKPVQRVISKASQIDFATLSDNDG